MTVFGYAISLTLVLQVVTTTFLFGLYAFTESMNEQKADHTSHRNMALLAAFLLHHHPSVNSLAKLADMTEEELAREITYYRNFAVDLHNLLATGALPEFAMAARSSLRDHVEMVVSAPLAGMMIPFLALDEYRLRIYRVSHTVYRKNFVSKIMIMLAVNLSLVVLAAELLLQHHPIVCGLVVLLPVLGIVGCISAVSILIMNQQRWKEYWTDRLLEIMAIAAHDKNHDLFNRALFLKSDIESQPDLPIPGKLSLYTTVYSVVQVGILFLAKTMHFS